MRHDWDDDTSSPTGLSARSKGLITAVVVLGIGLLAYRGYDLARQINATMEALNPAPTQAVAAPADKPVEVAGAAGGDAVAALKKITDYEAARWHPLHFKPAIETATNEQCLTCHQEVLTTRVRPKSPAGVEAAQSVAWYQTLDTYTGNQETFHARHLTSQFAKETMNLKCNFCHQGHDPREEAPNSSATAANGNGKNAGFTLRKVVDPSNTCLMCHGKFPAENMGLEGKWSDLREGLESPDTPNGCLTCHAEQFRTVRHQVNYLNAAAIEKSAAAGSSDTCFGCHGGRAWYRNSYPYARHPWPGMDATSVPDWAKDRATQSRAEHVSKP
jgi:hypothetical protein